MLGRLLIAFSLLALVIFAPAASAADLVGQASIIDGDTIEIHGQRIRLFGIDAPEHDQLCEAGGAQYRCGQQAALALSDQIGHQTVDCVPHDVDQYGRVVAVCSAGGEDDVITDRKGAGARRRMEASHRSVEIASRIKHHPCRYKWF